MLKSVFFFYFVLLACVVAAQAAEEGTIQFKSDKYAGNFETGITKARGNVKVYLTDQTLFSDESDIDSSSNVVTARGHVHFTQGKYTMDGEEMTINMKTGHGIYHNVILRIGQEIHLEAVSMERVEADRFIGKNVKISSCVDCPESWSVTGTYADFRTDDFAEVHNAIFQINDIPVSYFPVFAFPTGSKRRSGFLIPSFSSKGNLGFQFILPYYWVHSDYSDSTFEYRYMSTGGQRIGGELRTEISERTYVKGNGSYVQAFDEPTLDPARKLPGQRYGYAVGERAQLSPHWVQRFNGEMASDTSYSNDFDKEFPSFDLPSLANEPSVSYQNYNSIGFGRATLNRDNLPRANTEPGLNKLPEFEYALPSYGLFGPVRGNASIGGETFSRFDDKGYDSTGWIREGQRGTLIGRLSAPVNFYGSLDWSPSVVVRTDLYHFPSLPPGETDPNAYRSRVFFDQTLGTQISRVYSVDGQELKAIKHTIEPSVRWSYSPEEIAKDHPFFNNPNSPRFDLFDPRSPDISKIALGSVDEEQRLGDHHLLTLGIDSRVVGRYGDASRRYEEFLDFKVEQDVNLWIRPDSPDRFSRLRMLISGSYGGFELSTDLAINIKTGNTNFKNTAKYSWNRYSITAIQNVVGDDINTQSAPKPKDKTYTLAASIKTWGPWTFSGATTYDALTYKSSDQMINVIYNSPSKCWGIGLLRTRADQAQPSWSNHYTPMIRFSFKEFSGGSSVF